MGIVVFIMEDLPATVVVVLIVHDDDDDDDFNPNNKLKMINMHQQQPSL